MSETAEPRTVKGVKKRSWLRAHIWDLLIGIVLVVVILGLADLLVSKLSVKHEVSSARVVSDKVILDMQKQDATDAYKLGGKKFQQSLSAAQLAKQFDTIKSVTSSRPSVDNQTLYKDHVNGDIVFVIYKFPAQVPFYIRLGIIKESGQWKLTSVKGSVTESELIVG